MIRGRATARREIEVPVSIYDGAGRLLPINAVLDTGFTGDLSLQLATIQRLGLPFKERLRFSTATGQVHTMNTYTATIIWDQSRREIVVVEAEARGAPLIGVNLIWNSRVTIDARDGGLVTIELNPEGGES